MPRKVYIVGHAAPATAGELAAAAAAGAGEILFGIPPALAGLGVQALGFHSLPDPAPQSAPQREGVALINALAAEGIVTDAKAAKLRERLG